MSALADTIAQDAQDFLAAVEAIREESNPDFLRFGSERDKARQERGDQGTLVERVKRASDSYKKK